MKKIVALLLAAVMCLSFVACGGSTEYQVGDTFGTDAVELKLINASFGDEYYIKEEGVIRAPNEGQTFILIDFSLKNIGKTKLGYFPTADKKDTYIPGAIVTVDYNDGYTYSIDSFNTTGYCTQNPTLNNLEPLAEAATYSAYISVPKEVAENTDAPLLVKFHLVNSSGRGEVVTYSIR